METTPMPSMKPVLITAVSDDIRALRGTDVSQQQTALSARAVADVFAGDLIAKTNPTDDKYFVKNGANVGKIDVDLIVDSGCRYIPHNAIIHGPEHATSDSTATGDPLGGFMYTLAVLPSGELFWGGQGRGTANGGISFPEASAPSALRGSLDDGSFIRQVFWVHSLDEDDVVAYTRIGHYKKSTNSYVWGGWTLLGGEMLYIIVTDPYQQEVVTPMVNATYSVHCNVSNFILPNANSYKYGTKIRILQYPDPDAMDRSAWFTRVTYTDLDENKGIDEDFELLCTPSPNRNTAKQGEAYLEDLSPTCYEFSVIPLVDSTRTVIGRTWQLDVNAEETEFTSGIAELLGSHTDPGVNDFVDYLNVHYKEESTAYSQSYKSTLVFNRAMPSTGYVNGKITKLDARLADGWTTVVKCVATTSDANFNLVNTTDTSKSGYTRYPTAGVLYFHKRTITEAAITRDVYELAIDPSGEYEPGYLNPGIQFTQGTTYYTLSSTAHAETICTVKGEDLEKGESYEFHKYLNRHNILYVSIQPIATQHHLIIREGQYANVQIGITADPHRGSYITKQNLNRSAYTQFQFERLKERREFCTDLIDQEGHSATTEEVPASTQALINSHNDIASRLQAKGLFTGIVDCGYMSSGVLDELVSTGIYRAMPFANNNTLTFSDGNNLGWPKGTSLSRYADIVVLGGTVAGPSVINEECQYIATEEDEPAASTTYYIWDHVEHVFTLAENNGHPPMFKPNRKPYYTKQILTYIASGDQTFVSNKRYYKYESGIGQYVATSVPVGNTIPQPNSTYFERLDLGIRDTNEITQVVYQYSTNGMNMWYRHKINGGTWSCWMRSVRTPVYVDYTARSSISDTDVLNAFKLGSPTIRCGAIDATTTTTTVTELKLPDPSELFAGDVLRVEFIGSQGKSILYISDKATSRDTARCTCKFEGSTTDYNVITCLTDGNEWRFAKDTFSLTGKYGPSDGTHFVLAVDGDTVNSEVTYYTKSGSVYTVASPQPTGKLPEPNTTYWINAPLELNRVKNVGGITTQIATLNGRVDSISNTVRSHSTDITTLKTRVAGIDSAPYLSGDIFDLAITQIKYKTKIGENDVDRYAWKIVCDDVNWSDNSVRLVYLDLCSMPEAVDIGGSHSFYIYVWTPDLEKVRDYVPPEEDGKDYFIGTEIAKGYYAAIHDPLGTLDGQYRGWWSGVFPVKRGTIFTLMRAGGTELMHSHAKLFRPTTVTTTDTDPDTNTNS